MAHKESRGSDTIDLCIGTKPLSNNTQVSANGLFGPMIRRQTKSTRTDSQLPPEIINFPNFPFSDPTLKIPHNPHSKYQNGVASRPAYQTVGRGKTKEYYNETHQPTTHQLNRFSATCKLLKENLQVLRQNKSSTRQRKLTARENLEKISKLSSSVFALYSFLVTVSEIGQKSYLELIPKLRNWWRSVEHPERLLETVKDICELEGIEYVM
ncbi:hypothetical protein ACJ73_04345 [Blastomyces percursus]|uniref:Uncharacterized protein n=1 Tax=Blastomyces percursus TaxID=1658174 RepID=A0A1J9QVP1_9EURO|nr:hypothetical protein ACJ73_04345 [Blastomyces percursus]